MVTDNDEVGDALAVNIVLTLLDLCWNPLGEEGGMAIGKTLSVNTTLTELNIGCNALGRREGGDEEVVMEEDLDSEDSGLDL